MSLGHARHRTVQLKTTLLAFMLACLAAYRRFGERVDLWARAVEATLPVDLSGEVEYVGTAVRGEAGQVQTVIAGVVIGAALLIGFFVVAQIDSALPQITDADLSADKNSTVDRIGDGLLIGGVVIIVLFAAVILRVLRGL